MQRGEDSQGNLEEDLDHRHQYTYKMGVIKICGLLKRHQWIRIRNLQQHIYIYFKVGTVVQQGEDFFSFSHGWAVRNLCGRMIFTIHNNAIYSKIDGPRDTV